MNMLLSRILHSTRPTACIYNVARGAIGRTFRMGSTRYSSNGMVDRDVDAFNYGDDSFNFKVGQSVKAEVIMIGKLGAGVVLNGDPLRRRGLILTSELDIFKQSRGKPVIVGEILPAFVERVTADGGIHVQLRPILLDRIQVVAEQILEALEASPNVPPSIPVGDKSKPEQISSFFYGVTKQDFKQAVGMLYRNGFVIPGKKETQMHNSMSSRIEEGNIGATPGLADTLVHQMKSSRSIVDENGSPAPGFSPLALFKEQSASAALQVNSDQPFLREFIAKNLHRHSVVFLANLPFGTTQTSLYRAVAEKLGDPVYIVELQVSRGPSVYTQRRNALVAWVMLLSEDLAGLAAESLRTLVLENRRLVVAYCPSDTRVRYDETKEDVKVRREERHQTLLKQLDERSKNADSSELEKRMRAQVFGIEDQRKLMRTAAERAIISLQDMPVLTDDVDSRHSFGIDSEVNPFEAGARRSAVPISEVHTAARFKWDSDIERKLSGMKSGSGSSSTELWWNHDAKAITKDVVQSVKGKPTNKRGSVYGLYFGNLPYTLDDNDVLDFIAKCVGPDALADIRMSRDPRTSAGLGYAHVDFHKEEDAKLVFNKLHGELLMGRPIIIEKGGVSNKKRVKNHLKMISPEY